MSITIYPSQFNMREDGSYEQLPAIKGEQGEQGVPGVGALPGGTAGQVPVKQSADDYDVAWEDVGWQLLWTNASPTSSFAAQTVPLDLSEYSELLVSFRMGDGGIDATYYVYGVIGDYQTFQRVYMTSNTSYQARRSFQSSQLGISFGDGYEGNVTTSTGSNAVVSNSVAQPIKIYAL